MDEKTAAIPQIVSQGEWEAALECIRIKEKAETRRRDALAAERRRLPMMEIATNYFFEAPQGRVRLLDLFEGRPQLIIYHFMFAPGVQGWPDAGCDGCSFFADQICHLAHIHARSVSLAFVSRAPLGRIEAYRQRMGWRIPWVSSEKNDFNTDFGLSRPDGETFGLSVFFADRGHVYRSYFTNGRGVEALGPAWTFFDIVPYGRQEKWEDSPEGWPQSQPYAWWRRHDEY